MTTKMERVRAPVAHRIATARQQVALQDVVVARELGISIAAYHDLEAHDDDAFMCVSLGQLRSLGELLNVAPRMLVAPEGGRGSLGHVSVEELVDRIRRYLGTHSLSTEQFEAQVGWAISEAIRSPEAAWHAWNLDALQDICGVLGVDWLLVLPDTATTPAVQA